MASTLHHRERDERRDEKMTLAALLPLAWALAGLAVVVRLSGRRTPPARDATRIDVTHTDGLRPAA
jgi:hypothetical protein